MKLTPKTIAIALMLALGAAPQLTIAAEGVQAELSVKELPQVKVQGSSLVIEVPGEDPCHVVINALTGQVIKQFDAHPGINQVDLPAGIYIVRAGQTVLKVAVK